MEECASCIYSRFGTADDQELPVFKCHRYPPTIFVDAEGQIAQAFPDAWMSCGEFTAEKTSHVVGTIRKVKEHATRISNRVIGHLHRGDRRHRSLQDSGSADQP